MFLPERSLLRLVMAEDWSAVEVAAIVSDYREMLRCELAGLPFSKAKHRSALRRKLNGRSDGSVEFKHANISAVLIELGFPFIAGYKQRVNVQERLRVEVAAQLHADHELQVLASRFVAAPVTHDQTLANFDDLVVPPPKSIVGRDRVYSRSPATSSPRLNFDYLGQEARNASLGLAGEKFVLEFEHRRLWNAGAKVLAERVEHVSKTKGDGLGYDVLSFEPDGRDRLIEVKTTSLGLTAPFFASQREVSVSEANAEHFHLYRLFKFREKPKLFMLHGALSTACQLEAIQYRATVR